MPDPCSPYFTNLGDHLAGLGVSINDERVMDIILNEGGEDDVLRRVMDDDAPAKDLKLKRPTATPKSDFPSQAVILATGSRDSVPAQKLTVGA